MITVTRLITTSFLLAGVCLLTACHAPDVSTPAPRTAMVVQPQPAQGAAQVFSGDVRARHEPALAFRVAGKITQRHVDIGTHVKAGTVLAELDDRDIALQVEAAQAQVQAARADFELARAEKERHAEMMARKLISQSLFDAKQATLVAAQARLEQAQAQWDTARNQRQYTHLIAPQDGVIASRHAEAGQVVSAGQTLFVLAVDGPRDVQFSIPEHQIALFSLEQPVLVELWANPGQYLPGKIREMAGSADSQSRTFSARVAVDLPDTAIALGQSARVLVAEQHDRVFSLPLSAVGGEAGSAFVWVLDPQTQRAHRRPVQVVRWEQQNAVIAEGVSLDDWVVSAGVHLIAEGEPLRTVDRENRPVTLQGHPQ